MGEIKFKSTWCKKKKKRITVKIPQLNSLSLWKETIRAIVFIVKTIFFRWLQDSSHYIKKKKDTRTKSQRNNACWRTISRKLHWGRGRVNPDNGMDWKEIKQMFGERNHKYILEKSLTVKTFKHLWGYLLKIWISRKRLENLNKYKAWCSHQYLVQVSMEGNGKEDGAGGHGAKWTRLPSRVRSST